MTETDDTISMPVSALWAKPFICRNTGCCIIENGVDVTDIYFPINHAKNREACSQTNRHNARMGERFGIKPPYYHYDALSGRALEIAR